MLPRFLSQTLRKDLALTSLTIFPPFCQKSKLVSRGSTATLNRLFDRKHNCQNFCDLLDCVPDDWQPSEGRRSRGAEQPSWLDMFPMTDNFLKACVTEGWSKQPKFQGSSVPKKKKVVVVHLGTFLGLFLVGVERWISSCFIITDVLCILSAFFFISQVVAKKSAEPASK